MILILTAIPLIIVFSIIIIINRKRKNISFSLKKIKKYRLVIILILLTTIINFVLIFNIPYFQKVISADEMWLDDILILVLVSISISINVAGILMIKIQPLYEKKKIAEIEKQYQNMNYEYYRDILKDIPPACLLYLYKGKINISDVIVAILLNLQMKKVIEIKDNGINFLDDIDIQHERYVIKSIYNGYNDKTFAKEFKEQLLIYLRENNYIYDGDKNKLNITYVMEYFMICMIIYGIELLFVLSSLPNEFRPALLLFIFLAYFLTFVGIPVVKFIQSKILAIIRTDKGIELSGKLQGLYNYLKDFSNINDMEVKNINLYNEYIIYAIIFDMKGTLNNECKQIYQNIKNISSYKKRKTIKN